VVGFEPTTAALLLASIYPGFQLLTFLHTGNLGPKRSKVLSTLSCRLSAFLPVPSARASYRADQLRRGGRAIRRGCRC